MARLPIQTLPAFRAVARCGNLRAAADDLSHYARSLIEAGLWERVGTDPALAPEAVGPVAVRVKASASRPRR